MVRSSNQHYSTATTATHPHSLPLSTSRKFIDTLRLSQTYISLWIGYEVCHASIHYLLPLPISYTLYKRTIKPHIPPLVNNLMPHCTKLISKHGIFTFKNPHLFISRTTEIYSLSGNSWLTSHFMLKNARLIQFWKSFFTICTWIHTSNLIGDFITLHTANYISPPWIPGQTPFHHSSFFWPQITSTLNPLAVSFHIATPRNLLYSTWYKLPYFSITQVNSFTYSLINIINYQLRIHNSIVLSLLPSCLHCRDHTLETH